MPGAEPGRPDQRDGLGQWQTMCNNNNLSSSSFFPHKADANHTLYMHGTRDPAPRISRLYNRSTPSEGAATSNLANQLTES